MEVKLFSNIDEIKAAWQFLQVSGKCYVFQSYEWVENYLVTVGNKRSEELFIISVNQKGHDLPFLIIPLAIYRKNGLRYLGAIGGHHADFAGIVIQPEMIDYVSAEFVWKHIIRLARKNNVDIIRIRKIPLLIDDIPNLLYTGACIHEEMNYSIILNESWDNYYSLRKSKIKADSKRRTKLLSEKGRLRFYVPSNKEEMIDLTKVMIQQKEARYKHKKFNNQFRDVENINFYSEATKNFPDGTPHLSALLLDNKIIAIHWGLVYDNRFYHIMPAHDHEWSKYAPGRLLLQNLIEWSFENKLEYFDFTCGDEIYKKDWSNIERSLYEYRQVLSLKARLFLYVFSKIELLKIVIKKNKTLFERPFAAFKGTARNN